MAHAEVLVSGELEMAEREAMVPTEGAAAWHHFALGPVMGQLSPAASLLTKAEPDSNPACHTSRPLWNEKCFHGAHCFQEFQ